MRPLVFCLEKKEMKLYLIFAVIDLLILLAYPIVYITHRIRKMMNSK
jgi:hypothetical protein